MPIDLTRPTLTRDIPELAVQQGQGEGALPELGLRNVPTNVQGPNPFLSILSDVLLGVSAGPQVQQRQQFLRQQGIEDIFSRAQEQAGTRSQLAQVQFGRQLKQAELDQPEFRVDAKGNVTIINPAALRKGDFAKGVIQISNAKKLTAEQFESEVDKLAKMSGIEVTPEEKGSLYVSFLDAVEANDITPFRQRWNQLVDQRRQVKLESGREEKREQRADERQAASDLRQQRGFQQQIEMQNRAFQHQVQMVDIRERQGRLRQQNSPQAQKNIENAKSGLRASKRVREMLFDDKGNLTEKGKNLLVKGAVPGALGAREFSAQRNEMIDVLTRLRTGAALNEEEQKFYRGQAPGALDITEPEAIKAKLKLFEDLYSAIAGGRGFEAAPPASDIEGQIKEGTIIRNPTTGERKIRRGGQWVPL